MKANELMLGDIITFKDSVDADKTPIPVKVIALGYQHEGDENEALVRIGNDEGCDIVIIDDEFVGYPLTAEILEKNGWEERKDYEPYIYYLLEDKDSSIALSKEWDSTIKTIYWSLSIGNYITDATFSVNYVHQLQHALRLCGIEKEITL